MAHINLLPWREERRKEQQRQFFTLLGLSVILMALIVVATHIQFARMVDTQNSRNDFLKRNITEVEKQIKEIDQLAAAKKRLLARMDVIQQLQRDRSEVVHLFDEIVRVIPEGVYLTSFSQRGKSLAIKGRAQSNARISAFMRNIEKSKWLSNPVLNIIQSGKAGSERQFVLRATQISNPGDKAS